MKNRKNYIWLLLTFTVGLAFNYAAPTLDAHAEDMSSTDFSAAADSALFDTTSPNPTWLSSVITRAIQFVIGPGKRIGQKMARQCDEHVQRTYFELTDNLYNNAQFWNRYIIHNTRLDLGTVRRTIENTRTGLRNLKPQCTEEIADELENASDELGQLIDIINRGG